MTPDADGTPDEDRPDPGLPAADESMFADGTVSDPSGETSPDPFESPETRTRFWCPGCDEEVNVSPESVGQLVRCPYCNTDFFASDEYSHDQVVDDTADQPERDRQNEIDTMRVRTLSRRRMAVVRAASWWSIGLIMSLVGMLSFTARAIRLTVESRGWGIWPTVCLIVVSGFAWLARKCAGELRTGREEMKRHDLPGPEIPPDFSTLGDGRDRWKEFEHIR